MPITDVIKNKLGLNKFEGTPPDAKFAKPELVGMMDDTEDFASKVSAAETRLIANEVSNADLCDRPELED